MKLAVISDGHLFQTFVKRYDSLIDFEKVLYQIGKNEPDAKSLVFAEVMRMD